MSARPNILFLLSDEHSHRFMGCTPPEQGRMPVRTPTLDGLAAHGTRFDAAYCQMPLCSPSRMSLLTGLECRNAGAWWNEDVLRPELPTLPGLLGAAGYDTCLLGKMHLAGSNQSAGFARRPYGDLTGGLGHQWEPLGSTETGPYAMRFRTEKTGVTGIPESLLQERVIIEEAVAYLREQRSRDSGQPWLLMCSFSRPHFPLTAPARHISRYGGNVPPPFTGAGDAADHPHTVGLRAVFQSERVTAEECAQSRAAYCAAVDFLDETLGDMLALLERDGFLENTIIVYTSDHGEMAGEHGVWWKQTWQEGSSRVPLIISLPEQRCGGMAGLPATPVMPAGTVAAPVGLTDLLPTLCSLANVAGPDKTDGRDLAPVLRGSAQAPNRPVVCDSLTDRFGPGTEFRMVRQGRYKYVHFRNAPPLCFDLENDPGEQHDLCRQSALCPEAQAVADFAAASMDFDAADRERTVRDGGLLREHPLPVPAYPGNVYHFPCGWLVAADEALLRPQVLHEHGSRLFCSSSQE